MSRVHSSAAGARSQQPKILVRQIRPSDADQLSGLILELAEHQGKGSKCKLTAEILRKQLSGPSCPFECLVAENDEHLAGFALFFPTYSTWEGKPGIYLEDFFVRPEMRGFGVGRLLLKRLARLALERGCARVDWNVLQSNTGASSFYKKLGATRLPDWHHWRFEANDLHRLAVCCASESHHELRDDSQHPEVAS